MVSAAQWWTALAFIALIAACSSEQRGATEVLVSIDAKDAARDATSVRVQVNDVVVEVPRDTWPQELIVQPGADGAKPFEVRAWGFLKGKVVGAGLAHGVYSTGVRRQLALSLVPGFDAGAPPRVNADAKPSSGPIRQPTVSDGGGLDGDSSVPGAGGPSSGGSTTDAGAGIGQPDGGEGSPTAGCSTLPTMCSSAELLGTLDAADAASVITRTGSGSGWFAVDLTDSNKDASSNSVLGIGVALSAPAGATYAVTLVGDTSADGGGRCVGADVADTDSLHKTAIWGAYGTISATKRRLAVHVEKVAGTCDVDWTLTLSGNPCPGLSDGVSEASMGSCP